MLSGKLENVSLEKFWLALNQINSCQSLANFIVQVTALPQSTAVAERMFSKINLNKTKLRNRLAISTLESIAKVTMRSFLTTSKLPTDWPIFRRRQEVPTWISILKVFVIMSVKQLTIDMTWNYLFNIHCQ